MLSLHKFYFDAITLARTNKWRYGQAMFEHLCTVRPDLSAKVHPDMDPYYVSELKGPRWDKFVAFIEANWHKCESCAEYWGD